jgi:glycosyltransferase involved in cell wall biosynthesis
VPIPAFTRQYLEFTPTRLSDQLEAFLQRYPTTVFTYVRMRPLFFPVPMIDGLSRVMRQRPDVGLVLCGGLSHMEPWLWREVQSRIEAHDLTDRICLVEDLDHNAFLVALTRAAVYLRTPITDGVASSVLEALALGVPVVASENGTRPAGVLTYPAEDPERLAAAIDHVLAHRAAIVATLAQGDPVDTLTDEVAVLVNAGRDRVRAAPKGAPQWQ